MTERELTPAQVSFGLRISVIEGAFATIHAALLGGVFMTGLALRWGANAFQFGLLSAIPALFTAASLLGALLVSQLGHRKTLTLVTAVVGRSVFLGFLPFLLARQPMPMPLFLGLVATYNLCLVIAGNAWTSWMGDLVPASKRGRYFGARNTVMNMISTVFTFGVGRFLDANKTEMGFTWVCLAGLAAGILAMVLLRMQPEPALPGKLQRPWPSAIRAVIQEPLRDQGFRKFIRFVATWSLVAPLASPFYSVHLLKHLSRASYSLLGSYIALSAASGIAFQWLWGRIIDRYGAKPVLRLNLLFTGFLPLCWVIATPSFMLPIWLDAVGNGLFWGGVNLGWFSMLLGLAQGKPQRDAFFAFFTAVTGLGGFLAALVGGVVAQMLSRFHWNIGPFQFVNFHVLFLAAGLGRFAVVGLVRSIPEEGARSMRELLGALGNLGARGLSMGKELVAEGLGAISERLFPG
ncbi:MAG: MFS transporter [candidate division WOR-3 bacterium]